MLFLDDLLHHIHKCEEAICELEATFNEVLNKYNNKDYYGAVKAFKKINKYGDNLTYKDLKLYYDKCLNEIEKIKSEKYNNAVDCMLKENYLAASYIFKEITDYKDSNELMKECNKLEVSKDNYEKAKKIVSAKKKENYYEAIDLLEKNKTYKDSSALIRLYWSEIAKINRKAKQKKIKILSSILAVLIIAVVVMFTIVIPNTKLNNARKLITERKYDEAEVILNKLGNYKNSAYLLEIVEACKELNNGNFEKGISLIDKSNAELDINYDLNGGILIGDEPQKDGNIFIEWEIKKFNLTNEIEKYSFEINVSAVFEELYYLEYDLGGGECSNLPTEFTESTKFNLPIPTKQGYTFIGWYDENDELVSELNNKDYTLIAKYGPFIKENNYIYFGRYPQTKVTDSYIINALNQIITINEYGYIEYDGNEYKEYNDNYYLVEPIKWKILETNNNSYKLVSDLILDHQKFYSSTSNRTINVNTIYPNNYEYSDIRAWLNNEFISAAFNTEEQNIINVSLVDNSASTTNSNTNGYVCNNTNDKVYLLSYKDVTEKYFTTSSDRRAKVTDYAKDKGVYEENDYGYFWLRSPYYHNRIDVYCVNYDGSMSYFYFDPCDSSKLGARPALEIKIK